MKLSGRFTSCAFANFDHEKRLASGTKLLEVFKNCILQYRGCQQWNLPMDVFAKVVNVTWELNKRTLNMEAVAHIRFEPAA